MPVTAHPTGGTGLSWWKVCTNYPTCSTFQTQPFPPIGPDVTGGGPVIGYTSDSYQGHAYDIPAAIAWKTLPVDPSYQVSYTISSSSWSGGVETLTLSSNFAGGVPKGEFTVTSGPCAGTWVMSNSSANSTSYPLASNPGSCTGATLKYPNVRVFNETVYQLDSGSSVPAVTITPSPIAFANQAVGTLSSPLVVTVSNTGTATLVLSSPYYTLSGTNSADFHNLATGSCVNGGSVSASGSCTVILQFAPSTSLAESATFTINGNASGSASISANGFGVFPTMTVGAQTDTRGAVIIP
jgi:hypothetical protein